MSRARSVVNDRSMRLLTEIVQRAATAASFDVAELSSEEVVEVYRLLDGLTDALWNEHADVLLPINRFLLSGIE